MIVYFGILHYTKTFAHVGEEIDIDVIIQVRESHLLWQDSSHIVLVILEVEQNTNQYISITIRSL